MSAQKYPKSAPGYQLEQMDDEILLFNPVERQVLYSNNTGALIWQLCDGERSVAEISQMLQAAFPGAETEIETDVTRTLDNFAEHGAIQWV